MYQNRTNNYKVKLATNKSGQHFERQELIGKNKDSVSRWPQEKSIDCERKVGGIVA